ncbi:gp2 protein [Mycobacteroides abscessus subsp. abscessus]|nr:gp2 protein [Mycobacteroides abscessus subsp. abscessus]SKY60172.1 gp2 protein [Mycobacteroides abscessus subsp. abscessus]
MSAVLSLAAARYVRVARARRRPGSPAESARRLDPKFRVTQTIRLLSDLAVRSVREPDQRDVVNTPPRTGKSQSLAIWTSAWVLGESPDLKIVIVSYSDELAQTVDRKDWTVFASMPRRSQVVSKNSSRRARRVVGASSGVKWPTSASSMIGAWG